MCFLIQSSGRNSPSIYLVGLSVGKAMDVCTRLTDSAG